jgi:uncharacterized protein with LGFP repeats
MRQRRPRVVVGFVAALASAFAVLSPVPAGAAEAPATAPLAVAAAASDWDPGYIIDDAVFYDGNAMSATDVQAFLNGKVASCQAGYTCLKGYGQPTGNLPADAYCNGYAGAPYQTAAQIIDLVARSCGVSQRALLVLLEKEQGLVTSRAPSDTRYRAATGMGCPDTAPCDPAVGGFFYQVYYAARQFEIYRLKPASFNHRAGSWNAIRKNPNAGCGTTSVFIYNQATAGLYNYTPYLPNESALANLYGTGDSCASYGNRNFWRIFTDWFGNPRTYVAHEGFVDYWNARGGAAGPMGSPISYAVYVEQNGQGWYQRFQGGTIYGSFSGGTAFVANNVILAEYNRQGGPYGAMGWPNGEQQCSTGVRCSQSFVAATISTTSTYGAHVLWGGIRDQWLASGGTDGAYGAALNDMSYYSGPNGVAYQQNFQNGILVQGPSGFQLVPYTPILTSWLAAGGGAGPLGWPTGPAACAATGCAQSFAGATLTSGAYGAQQISGGFVSAWQSRGGLEGGLGVAFGPLRYSSSPLGWAQNYAGGILTQSAAGFRVVPYGAIQALWTASGGERGSYGWPTGDRECVATGCVQQFTGAILSESSWGTYATYGGLAAAWTANAGASAVGPAINGVRASNVGGGGWVQHYAEGVITQSLATGTVVYTPYSPILSLWYYYGAEATWLGWPASAPVCDAGGACTQQFQNGVARSTAGGAVSFSAT